ncbi:hypothetical protein CcCBS67573_g02118 [Chytriomyces confervae]|uniref:Small ribosomal subunit protein mS29 n=1 Tax=Chytriomyces confervae TaxID=246404 RepID=A0A507FMI6_9FUNG|nr:37S ribosomal protein S23 mitochondrial [Chytriomyces hyalinus]TPX76648.1 hypothetical protein CcCBS67573_g02118 [Chytriomyces confervae]
MLRSANLTVAAISARRLLSSASVSATSPAPPATPAPTAASNPAAASTPSTSTDAVSEWTPALAVPEKLNSLFRLPSASNSIFTIKNSSASASQSIKKALASSLFLENMKSTVMLRDSWLSLLSLINSEVAKSESKMKIFLDGASGAGKSTYLTHVATHFKSFGFIVVHLPNVANWVSGLEPYAQSPDSPHFTQPAFTSTVLKQIHDVNAEVVVKGSYVFEETPFSGTLSELLSVGIESPSKAHKVLDSFISELLEHPENRPKVLFSFDQVNALYTTTSYNDTNSNPILSSQLELLRPFLRVMSTPVIPKGIVVCACDNTNTKIRSPFLSHLLQSIPQAITKDLQEYTPPTPKDLSPFSATQPSSISSQSSAVTNEKSPHAIVSETVSPALYDPFTFDSAAHPRGVLARYNVPGLQPGEAYALIEGLRKTGALQVSKVSDAFVVKAVMLTNGNAKALLNYCI